MSRKFTVTVCSTDGPAMPLMLMDCVSLVSEKSSARRLPSAHMSDDGAMAHTSSPKVISPGLKRVSALRRPSSPRPSRVEKLMRPLRGILRSMSQSMVVSKRLSAPDTSTTAVMGPFLVGIRVVA